MNKNKKERNARLTKLNKLSAFSFVLSSYSWPTRETTCAKMVHFDLSSYCFFQHAFPSGIKGFTNWHGAPEIAVEIGPARASLSLASYTTHFATVTGMCKEICVPEGGRELL